MRKLHLVIIRRSFPEIKISIWRIVSDFPNGKDAEMRALSWGANMKHFDQRAVGVFDFIIDWRLINLSVVMNTDIKLNSH